MTFHISSSLRIGFKIRLKKKQAGAELCQAQVKRVLAKLGLPTSTCFDCDHLPSVKKRGCLTFNKLLRVSSINKKIEVFHFKIK